MTTTTTIAVPTSCAALCTKLAELAQRIDAELAQAGSGAAIDYGALEQRVADALTGALEHQDLVWSAAFSPDGTRVVTASWDQTARVWDISPDTGTLDQWSAVAERSPFVLSEQRVLVRRSPPRAQTLFH